MQIKVEVKNELLGDSIFWEGDSENITQINNIPAFDLATLVVKDGQTRKNGMWVVSEIKEKS